MMEIKPTDEVLSALNKLAKLKNISLTQASEQVLEIYSVQYLKTLEDAKTAAKSAAERYDI